MVRLANTERRRSGRRADYGLLVSCFAVAGCKLWLTTGQQLIARENPLDQVRYLQMARSLVEGQWLGPYGPLTLIREPGYPFWVALVHALALPLRWSNEALLLAAAAVFSAGLRRIGLSRAATFGCFAVIALEPHSLVVHRDALPASFYLPVLLLALAGLLWSIAARTVAGRAGHAGWAGLLLGLLWVTRPEKPVLAGLLLLVFVTELASLWRSGSRWRRAVGLAALTAGLPLLAIAGVTGSIRAANQRHYGVVGTTQVSAPGYLAANRALLSIEQRAPRRFVPVPREVRERAYAASPAFRELQDTLEGPSWARNVSCKMDRVCDDISANSFRWLLHEAVAVAGHMKSAPEAEVFFHRIADEIDAECRSGGLVCRRSYVSFLHPVPGTYVGHIGSSLLRVSRTAFVGPGRYFRETSGDHPDVAPAIRRLFDAMAGRGPRSRSGTADSALAPAAGSRRDSLRRRGEALLWSVHPWLYTALAGLAAAAAWWLAVRRRGTDFSAPVFRAFAWLAFLAIARLSLLTLVDASSFPARSSRHVYAAVPLTGCALLLLIDRAGRGLRRSARLPLRIVKRAWRRRCARPGRSSASRAWAGARTANAERRRSRPASSALDSGRMATVGF